VKDDKYVATEIPPMPRTFDLPGIGDVFDSEANRERSRSALQASLPKAGEKPYYNQVQWEYSLKSMALDNTDEGYFVDRCYSSTIDAEGMQLIDRLITVCAEDVKKGGSGNIPQEIYREDLDIPVLSFFIRIKHNKEFEVGYKLALQNNRFPKEDKVMHDHWDDWTHKHGYPPRFDAPPTGVFTRASHRAPYQARRLEASISNR
jgi:hypothetical protein